MVKIALDLLDVVFFAVAQVALEGDPCSKQWIRSCAQVMVSSCRPSIDTKKRRACAQISSTYLAKSGPVLYAFFVVGRCGGI